MKFSRLLVEITRSRKTRNLAACVVMRIAPGGPHCEARGANLLTGRRLRKIETAKAAVLRELGAAAQRVDFDVKATPDLQPPYLKTARRRELTVEVSS